MAGTVALLIAVAAALGSAPAPQDPMAVVQHGIDQVIVVFNDSGMPLATRRQKLRAVSEQYIDFADMARSALGYHWRQLTPAQRDEFVPLFGGFIQDAFLSKLKDTTVRFVQNETKTARITFQRERFDDPNYAEVFSAVALVDQKDPLQINYMMHRRGSGWLVYDVKIDGISVIANYRNQFNRVINNDGFDHLVAELTAKRAQLERLMNQPSTAGSAN
jgi:phospholipid transport system substrate-binding protein